MIAIACLMLALLDGPAPPSDAVSKITVPEGFKVTLFASEPDVRQPIAQTIDARGRLWVAENYSYPNWRTKPEGKDRILIFEDVDGDGKFDTRKVFWEKGANLTGIALGFGGVWACETPNLVFIPDADGDDVPDGEARVELDGWDVKGQHNLFNALTWGPDGWLYGCNGIMSNSLVGRPGTPNVERTPINCGVWRFHPTRKVFEAVAHGTTNPWGLDFDDHGQAFITNCVIPHAFRVVPGAHFIRMYGQDINPFSYALMGATADHLHWAGGAWTDSRGGTGKHGEAGGGHAHVGAMVYLGDNWPDKYRDTLFTNNLHGHRVNNDALKRQGSGYVATHEPDFFKVDDPWFRGMELRYGPDGGVYLTDWSDIGECHETDADGPHRENGRIYKVTYGAPKPVHVDLTRLDNLELARLQSHKNEWFVRNARRILQERSATQDMKGVHELLGQILRSETNVPRRLRALWTLHSTGGLDEPTLVALLEDREEWIRAWSVRLLVDQKNPSPVVLARFASMATARDHYGLGGGERSAVLAKPEPSPLVRLELASALQRIPVGARASIAIGLASRAEDASDPSILLMLWYGMEPLVELDRGRAGALAATAEISMIRRFVARRAVAADDKAGDGRAVASILSILTESSSVREADADILDGLIDSFRGRASTPIPSGWASAYDRLSATLSPRVKDRALALALEFGDPRAVTALTSRLTDKSVKLADRLTAIQMLAERRVEGLGTRLIPLLDETDVRTQVLRALSGSGGPETPGAILARYPRFGPTDRVEAISTLATRPKFAVALLGAVKDGVVPRSEISVTTARQLLALNDPEVAKALEAHWGTIRSTSADKTKLIVRYKTLLKPDSLKAADVSKGRALFSNACVSCHKMYGEGGDVGPELTGSDRANADYILENVLDPSASVPREYRLTTVNTTDGRTLSGMILDQSEKTVVIRTVNDRVVLPRESVEEIKPSTMSMMPEGLFEKLTDAEVVDLLAYLATRTQVPLTPARP